MLKAVDLLEHTDMTLDRIAESAGYGSESAFSAAFSGELGMAPGRYRSRFNDQSEHFDSLANTLPKDTIES